MKVVAYTTFVLVLQLATSNEAGCAWDNEAECDDVARCSWGCEGFCWKQCLKNAECKLNEVAREWTAATDSYGKPIACSSVDQCADIDFSKDETCNTGNPWDDAYKF